MHPLTKLLTHVGLTVIVPLLVAGLMRLFPVKSIFSEGTRDFEILRKRNNWIDVVACVICLIGLWSAVVLYVAGMDNRDPWGLAFGFGMSVIAPLLWITAVTLPGGKWRFAEFWVFYEVKYKVNWKGLAAVFLPLAALGVVSTVVLTSRLLVQ
ncbi:hypothetical protein ASA1KI_03620 [Opitutales bacterium ASA1]|nr:hypothetical protein ASA1KI_03620 [Opitutales bacterium ASA1]